MEKRKKLTRCTDCNHKGFVAKEGGLCPICKEGKVYRIFGHFFDKPETLRQKEREHDELLDKVKKLIKGRDSVSTKFLMKSFNIGYARAVYIIQCLEKQENIDK